MQDELEGLERDYSLYWEDDSTRDKILSHWQKHLEAHPEDTATCIETLLNAELKKTEPSTFLRYTNNSLAYRILSFALPKDETYFNQLDDYLNDVAQKATELGFDDHTTRIALKALNDPKHADNNNIDDQQRPKLKELQEFLENLPHPICGSNQLSFLLSHFAKIDLPEINWIERIRYLVDMSYADTTTPKRETVNWVAGVLPPYNSNTCANIEAEFSHIKNLHQIIKTTSENWEKLGTDKSYVITRFKKRYKSDLNDIFQLLIEQGRNSPDFPQETSLFNRLFMSNYFNENTTDRQIISCLVWHLKKANLPIDEAEKIINRFFKNNFENASEEMESLIAEYYKNIDPQIYTPTSGMATTQGGARGRYANERNQDTCFKNTLDATINTFTKKERGVIFKRSMAKLQQQHGQQEQQGATAIACVVSGNTYDILNVGDTTAILGRKNKTTGQVTFELINTTHNGNNSVEKKRLGRRKFNGTRLIVDPENPANRGLGVSRLIGYTQYRDVSHKPDTYHGTIKAKDNEEVFIVLASDGLSEADEYNVKTPGGFTEYLSERVNDFRGNLQQLPEYLIKKAIEDGSTDNITVAVIPLNTKNTQPSVTAIFDGNNGDEVSKALKENFQTTLEEEIDNQNQINEYLENLKKYRHIEGVRELVDTLNDNTSTSDQILANYNREFELVAERIEAHNKETLEKLRVETVGFRDNLNEQIYAQLKVFFENYNSAKTVDKDDRITAVTLSADDANDPKAIEEAKELNKKIALRNDLDALLHTTFQPIDEAKLEKIFKPIDEAKPEKITEQQKTIRNQTIRIKDQEVKLKNYGTSLFSANTSKRIEEQNGYKFLKEVAFIIAFIFSIPYRAIKHQWPWEKAGDLYLDKVKKELKPFEVKAVKAARPR